MRARWGDAEDQGARLLVTLVPYCFATNADRDRENAVLARLRAAAIPTLDLRTAFDDAGNTGDELYLPDGHWNAVGHRVAAGAIRTELLSRGWLGE